MEKRTVRALEAGALGIAVLVRVASLWSHGQTPYADHPMVDAFTYWQQAQQLLDGDDPFADGFYQPPGYPAFLWLIAELTGGPSLPLLRGLQAVMGVATSGLLLVLGRRVGTATAAPWAGKIPWGGALACVLYSLYPTALLFEQDVLTPALTGLLFTCALALLWVERPVDAASGRPAGPGPARTAGAGLCLGAAVVVHPTYLLAAGAAAVWLLSLLRPVAASSSGASVPWSRRLAPLAAFVFSLGLSLAPTTWMNTVQHQQPALVSHNSGVNFFLGNNLGWRDSMFLRPGLPFRKLVLEAEPHRREVSERNAYWWSRTRVEIAEHPVAWLSILSTKTIWSLSNRELPRNEDYRCRTDDGPMAWMGWLPVRFGLVFPLALVGAVSLARRRGPGQLLPLSWLALHLPLVLFIVADRYRLATWPVVCLAAVAGVAMVQRLVTTGLPSGPARWAWLSLLLVLPIPFLPLDARTDYDPAWCLHADANLALMDGDKPGGAALYRQALALDPDDWGARSFLARTLAADGQTEEAIAMMEPLIAWFPDHYPSLYAIARLEQRRGNLDAAADYMGRAWRVPGERTNTGVRYIRLLVEADRVEEARAAAATDPQLRRHEAVRKVLD